MPGQRRRHVSARDLLPRRWREHRHYRRRCGRGFQRRWRQGCGREWLQRGVAFHRQGRRHVKSRRGSSCTGARSRCPSGCRFQRRPQAGSGIGDALRRHPPPRAFGDPKRPINIAVGPLTKGGHPGIALSSGSSAYLYFGNGAGGFSGPRIVNLPGVDNGLAIGDVNGDGIPDLVSSGVSVAFGTGGGKFSKPYSYPIDSSGGSYNVALADLRNNGLMDIVTDAQNAISVLLSMGKGNYEDGTWTKVTGGAACGAAADFNRDGKPDLAVNTPTGGAILLGTGNAKAPFTTGATMALANTGCLLTGDLNGDGIPDLVVTTPTALVAYLGNGDGTFTQKSSTPIGPGAVVLADFNHDGKLDFATSGNLLALGNGDGTFQTTTALDRK